MIKAWNIIASVVITILALTLLFGIYQSLNHPTGPDVPIPPTPISSSNTTIVYGVVTGNIDLVGYVGYPISSGTAYFLFVDDGFYRGEIPEGTYEFVYFCQSGGSYTRNQIAFVSGEEFRLDVNGC